MYYVLYISYFFKGFDRPSRYICVAKTNLIQNVSSFYFVKQPLHVSGIFVAHHQVLYCVLYIQQLVSVVLFS
jgi:hypothetical protein